MTRAERFVEHFEAANPTNAMDAHAILAEYGFTPIPGGRILFEDGSTAEMLPATMSASKYAVRYIEPIEKLTAEEEANVDRILGNVRAGNALDSQLEAIL